MGGPAEATASADSRLPSSRGQGWEAGLWGPLSARCPPLVSTASPAAGSGPLAEALVLLPPRKHALARTSSPGPPATVALPAALATAAAGLQGALLGHLGSPCRVGQGLGTLFWACQGLGPPGWNRLGRGEGQGDPLDAALESY